MKILIRLALFTIIAGLTQTTWGQVSYPIEGTIIEGPVVSESYLGGTVVSSQYPVETIVENGVVNSGAVYADRGYSTASNVSQVSYAAPVSSQATVSGGSDGLLSVINEKRRRSGLGMLMLDPNLSQVAQNKSNLRANRRITGHDGSSYGGARVEGVGYAYGGNLTQRFNTCYLYANGYSYAGAGIAYDNSGRAYYTLLLR